MCESGFYEVFVDGSRVDSYLASAAENKYPCFGELALLYGRPRAASVVAKSKGKLWRLARAGFRLVQAHSKGGDIMPVLRRVEAFKALRFTELQQVRDAMVEQTVEVPSA